MYSEIYFKCEVPILSLTKNHLTDIEDGITLGAGLSPCSLSATEIDSRLRTLKSESPGHWENESGSIYRFLVKINL